MPLIPQGEELDAPSACAIILAYRALHYRLMFGTVLDNALAMQGKHIAICQLKYLYSQ